MTRRREEPHQRSGGIQTSVIAVLSAAVLALLAIAVRRQTAAPGPATGSRIQPPPAIGPGGPELMHEPSPRVVGSHVRSRRRTALLIVVLVAATSGLTAGGFTLFGPSARTDQTTLAHVTQSLPTTPSGFPHIREITVSATFDSRDRSYQLLEPATATTTALPLLVILHGTNASTALELNRTGFEPEVEAGHLALVLPDSVGGAWNSLDGCCNPAASEHLNDEAFVAAVTLDASTRVAVLPAERWLLGFSGGGKLAYTEACDQPGLFTKLAVQAASPQKPCTSAEPLFYGVGSADTVEPPAGKRTDGGGMHLPATTTVSRYTTLDGCTGGDVATHQGTVTIDTYSTCTDGPVIYAEWTGLGHYWPNSNAVPPGSYAEPLMWNFFTANIA